MQIYIQVGIMQAGRRWGRVCRLRDRHVGRQAGRTRETEWSAGMQTD